IEIGELLERVLLLAELQAEGHVRRDLLQEAQLLFADELAFPRAQCEHADARAIYDEGQRDHRAITLLQQLLAVRYRRLGLGEVVRNGDFTRPQRAPEQA